MKVDLHGLPLSEAKLKSQISVAEAWSNAFSTIELVHGHNLGTVIKDYIQQGDLLADIKRIYPEIPNLIIKDNGLGSTIVRFKRS
tara:strand:- start:7 stop:261 length:255 start_codon:yes stop_codon:yes gene_type:complete